MTQVTKKDLTNGSKSDMDLTVAYLSRIEQIAREQGYGRLTFCLTVHDSRICGVELIATTEKLLPLE
jgi:hypothetical protein